MANVMGQRVRRLEDPRFLTGAGTYVGPTGVDRVTDVCLSHASGNLYGIGNGPGRVYAMDSLSGQVTQTRPLSTDASILGLANHPGVPLPTPIEPVPVVLQPGYQTEVWVEAASEIASAHTDVQG